MSGREVGVVRGYDLPADLGDERDVDTERRRELCGEHVTLNGRPATVGRQRSAVGGWRNDNATVTALDNGEHYEWAWPTVARIVGNGGAFRS